MRIVSGSDQELYIITPDNNVCSFVGQQPARANPLHEAAPRQARETIADAFMSACASFAGNLQRGAFRNQRNRVSPSQLSRLTNADQAGKTFIRLQMEEIDMAAQTRSFDYTIDGKTFEAFLAAPANALDGAPKPGVLICHAWAGRSPFENEKAEALAKLGYTGVAIDLFGKGVLGETKEECQALIKPFTENRSMLQERLKATIDMVKDQPEVDGAKIAAIGFCFGGLCVLDIARSNADAAGVVSFHGLLHAPGNTAAKINPKVLALHGWDDPMATPDNVTAFGEEMTNAKADWQLHAYGGTMHAFTNPKANDPDFGTVYNADADRRSWQAMTNFLAELFG